jgi:hypothetical protein
MNDGRNVVTMSLFATTRRAGILLATMMVGLSASGAAQAQSASCAEDFQKYSQRRNAQMGALNQLGKANKGKIDPIAACPLFRKLVGIEGEMMTYLTKNKEWCGFPDQLLDQFRQGRAKNSGYAAQACSVAAKVKKMQEMQREQAASGGLGSAPAQKLPAGPL